MLKLYKKSELTFSLLWIGIYCIAMSAADNISGNIGIQSVVSLPVIAILSITLMIFVFKNGLCRNYGLCKPKLPCSRMLFYIPPAILLTVNLWHGVTLNYTPLETALYILTMLGVGFVEELIFRGLLFNAMRKNNPTAAVIVSSVTFGIGHIINLFNGSGMDIVENAVQIISAVAVGFMFVMIYIKSESLIICILTHGLFNSLSAFSDEAAISTKQRLLSCLFIVILCLTYTVVISRINKKQTSNE